MKAVNITHQQAPESQNIRLRQGKVENTRGPRHKGKITSSESTVKKLRQKVTSKLRACSK
jgi:hypothetical protein